MPRIVAWILRGVAVALVAVFLWLMFTGPLLGPERLAGRLFGIISLFVAAMIWELTKRSGSQDSTDS